MKYFKRIILTLIVLLVLLIGSVAGVGIWAYHHPKEAWAQIQSRFLPSDLKVDWNQLDLKVQHLSALNFKVDLKIKSLSVEKQSPRIHAPVDAVAISVSVFPFNTDPKLVIHEAIAAAPAEIEIKLPPSQETNSTNPFEQIQLITQKFLKVVRLVKLENVDLNVSKLTIQNEDLSETSVDLAVQKTMTAGPEQISYKAAVTTSSDLKINSSGSISYETEKDQTIYLDTKIDVVSPQLTISQNIKGKLGPLSEINSTGSVRYKKDKLDISSQPNIKLKLSRQSLSVGVDGSVAGLPESYVRLKNLKAQIDIPIEKNQNGEYDPAQFVVSAPVQIFATEKKFRTRLANTCQCEVPEVLHVKIEGPVWLENLLRDDEKKLSLIDLKFEIETVTNSLLTVASQGRLQINRAGKTYSYEPSLDFKAKIASFKKVSKVLDQFKILVPSPFDVLEGEVNLTISGPVVTTADAFQIPLQANAQLSSPNQVVDLTLTSSFDLKQDFKSANMDMHLFIHQLQLELPPLKPTQGNPRIMTDKRILLKPPVAVTATNKKQSFKLTMGFEVTTDKPGSIRLLAEYFKPYLPLTIKLLQKPGEKNVRAIQIEPFDIEYLRRKVKIETMALEMGDADENPIYINGRLSVQQTLYKIFIDVHGLAKNPNIILSSEPDLPRSEIINVLIYDRTSDQLASADVKTTGQIDAAMTDRAIGLFGIWAFAATPIRGFSYNPSTKVYAATIEISDGVTASIGTTWESTTQLAVQKRISRSWMLAASWTPADKDDPETTKLVLQWEKRVQ